MTPDLKTCQELEKAGYPQELELYAAYYTPSGKIFIYGTSNSIAYRKTPEDNDRNRCIAIPELTPLLDWFTKDFAERWAEKTDNSYGGFKLYRDHGDQWIAEIYLDHRADATDLFYHNPSPLTAVLELVKQMIKEME